MRFSTLLLCLVALTSVSTFAKPAKKAIPSSLKYIFDLKQEEHLSDFEEEFAGTASKLGLEVAPMNIMLAVIPVHYYATSRDFKKQVLLMIGGRTPTKYDNSDFKVKNFTLHNRKYRGNYYAILMKGFSDKEKMRIFNKLKSIDLGEKSSAFNFLINQAHAQETRVEGPSSAAGEDSPGFWGSLGRAFVDCGQGILDGANALLVDPFVDFYGAAHLWITDSEQFWANSAAQA
ncbi:MAG: hypothetical protein HRT45_06050 [Bdellovibrionales bacterium]|nr:hypothetical protein [Bdellovibrionales bacterium]